MNSAAKISTSWFGAKEKAVATAIGTLSLPLGVIGSFLIGPNLVTTTCDAKNLNY